MLDKMMLEEQIREINSERETRLKKAMRFKLPYQVLEEIDQETALKFLVNGLGSYNPRERFMPWYQISFNNKIKDHLRRQKRRIKIEDAVSFDVNKEKPPIYNEKGTLEKEYILERISEHVNRLDNIFKETIKMHYWRGMKLGEIAKKVGITEHGVWYRLKIAREKLKDSLLNSLRESEEYKEAS